MLTPKDPRRDADRRWGRSHSLDDGHTARMVAQIPVESALKISGFHEVVHPDFQFVVKRVLAVRPMAQEVMNVDAACVARRTDQVGDPRHLVKELVPRLKQVARLYPPNADAWVRAVEEKEPRNSPGRASGDHLRDKAT